MKSDRCNDMNLHLFCRSRFPVAIVVGSIIGGVAAVAVIACAFLYFCKKKSTAAEEEPTLDAGNVGPRPNMLHVPTDLTTHHRPRRALVDRILQEGETTGESSGGSFHISRGNTSATLPPSYTVS